MRSVGEKRDDNDYESDRILTDDYWHRKAHFVLCILVWLVVIVVTLFAYTSHLSWTFITTLPTLELEIRFICICVY